MPAGRDCERVFIIFTKSVVLYPIAKGGKQRNTSGLLHLDRKRTRLREDVFLYAFGLFNKKVNIEK